MGVMVQEVERGDSLQKKQTGKVQISREWDGVLYKLAGGLSGRCLNGQVEVMCSWVRYGE